MKWTKKKLNNLFLLIGIVAVVVMLFTFEVSFVELWQHICHAGYWLIPIIGIWLVVYAMNALAWRTIVHSPAVGHARVSFLRMLKLTITGYALNYATPVGGLGGEPYRILELSKDIGNRRATSSVILYVMMHFFSHFWLWFLSIFIYLALAHRGLVPLTPMLKILLAITTAVCLLAFYLFMRGYHKGMVFNTIRTLAHIPFLTRWCIRFLRRRGHTLRTIDAEIAALHQHDRRAFYASLLLEFFSRVVQGFEVMFMLLLFDIDFGGGTSGLALTFVVSVLIVAITSLLANILGFLPMQLGVQEGGFVVSIALLGFAPSLGIFVCIICRVREIIWIALGLALMRIGEKRPS